MKNNKACGEDEIINEYIKSTSNRFIPIYEFFFNIILDTGTFGILPQSRLIHGIIKPIIKIKKVMLKTQRIIDQSQ